MVYILFIALLTPCMSHAYEADVHYGLTKWLATKAGFDDGEAEAIALGDQRVDGGLIENMKSQLQYACLSPYPEDAIEVQSLHYPSPVKVPAPAAQRTVKAGGDTSIALAKALVAGAEGKAGFMLQMFGRALHPLQDAFAHEGTPATAPSDATVVCNDQLSMSAPENRAGAGAGPHRAELTVNAPENVSLMAEATYDYLLKYPRIQGRSRFPDRWDSIAPELTRFVSGSTKSEKASWFRSHGIEDTSFLDGTSLPDGVGWSAVRWRGRKLPALPNSASIQSGIHPDVQNFFNDFFGAWLTGPTALDVLKNYTFREAENVTKIGGAHPAPTGNLALKLQAWRLRDHGTATMLLARLDAGDKKAANEIRARVQKPDSTAHFVHVSEGVLPILVEGNKPSPLLPFVIYQFPETADVGERAVALVKLLDAPYETVALIATKAGDRWHITGIRSSFDY